LLISILLPALSRANDSARAIKCAANERSIGQAVQIYASQNKGKIFPFLNDAVWQNPSNTKEIIDNWYAGNNTATPPVMEARAYWGVPYFRAAGLVKAVFTCPSAAERTGNSVFTCYGQNGYGRAAYTTANPPVTAADRLQWFGV